MSSFEPLFSKSGRARLTPHMTKAITGAAPWMPRQVGSTAPRTLSIFELPPDDQGDSVEVAEALAAAQARQAELDAAYLRGMEQGREQGEAAERARLRGAMMAAESALDDVGAGESRWLTNVEENIAAIAVAVAHQLITREVTTASDVIVEIVTRAVQEFALDQPLSIRVNPGDLAALLSAERAGGDEQTAITRGRETRWVSDARIESGGCVVEGRERIVDGRVDTALERLYRRLSHTNA